MALVPVKLEDDYYGIVTQDCADNPRWSEAGLVHDWRNHAPDRIKAIWLTFTPEQRLALARSYDEEASNEHWD